jgi:hypothetical protein
LEGVHCNAHHWIRELSLLARDEDVRWEDDLVSRVDVPSPNRHTGMNLDPVWYRNQTDVIILKRVRKVNSIPIHMKSAPIPKMKMAVHVSWMFTH